AEDGSRAINKVVEARILRASEAPNDTRKNQDRDAVPGKEVWIVPYPAGVPRCSEQNSEKPVAPANEGVRDLYGTDGASPPFSVNRLALANIPTAHCEWM